MTAFDTAVVHEAGLAALEGIDLAALPEAMDALDQAALGTMAAVLHRAGLFRTGVAHRREQVLDRLRVAERHRWIVRGWLRELVRHERLTAVPGTDVLRGLRAGPPRSSATVGHLCAQLGYPPEVVTFFSTTANLLPRLLRDEITLHSVLFDADTTVAADGVYRTNVINSYLGAAASAAVQHALPDTGAVRVLELGAGVGATAIPLLDALSGREVEYLFTDVSRYFLDTADRQLAADRRVRFAILDINDPAPPGHGMLDAVVAANVLHNAIDVREVLTRVRSWLRPGGTLLLIESCRELLQAAVSMQLLMSPPAGHAPPGARDLRAGTDRIFLTRDEWTGELTAAGFTPLLAVPARHHELDALGQLLLVARTPAPTDPGAAR